MKLILSKIWNPPCGGSKLSSDSNLIWNDRIDVGKIKGAGICPDWVQNFRLKRSATPPGGKSMISIRSCLQSSEFSILKLINWTETSLELSFFGSFYPIFSKMKMSVRKFCHLATEKWVEWIVPGILRVHVQSEFAGYVWPTIGLFIWTVSDSWNVVPPPHARDVSKYFA